VADELFSMSSLRCWVPKGTPPDLLPYSQPDNICDFGRVPPGVAAKVSLIIRPDCLARCSYDATWPVPTCKRGVDRQLDIGESLHALRLHFSFTVAGPFGE
jgi:hypothetical protein